MIVPLKQGLKHYKKALKEWWDAKVEMIVPLKQGLKQSVPLTARRHTSR